MPSTPPRKPAARTPAERSPRSARLPEPIALAVAEIEDRKGREIVVLDLRHVSDATDFFVIASGTSDAHVRGIADVLEERLRHHGHRAHHIEGVRGGRWVLLDYVDFVIHVFHPETRAFYQLERLWGDAPELLASS